MGTAGPSGHLSLGGHDLSACGLLSSSLPSLPSIHRDLLLVFIGGQDYRGHDWPPTPPPSPKKSLRLNLESSLLPLVSPTHCK